MTHKDINITGWRAWAVFVAFIALVGTGAFAIGKAAFELASLAI